MSRKLVYVAHPYGGTDENLAKCEELISELTIKNYKNYVFVSPVLNFGHMYKAYDYVTGLNFCLDLLAESDMLLLAGEWKSSKGCVAEYTFAMGRGITCVDLKTFTEENG